MEHAADSSVVIVGAGPVGLTLAIDLADRGVDVTVLETRHAGEPPNVKCNQVSAHSMEIFRRLGLADRIRATTPDRLAVYLTARGITNETYYVAQKFTRFLGSNNIDSCNRT